MIVIILAIALIFRLLIAPTGFHIDIISNAAWGQWITTHGPLGFYTNNIWTFSWPTQPPFVSLIYAFDSSLYFWLLEAFRKIANWIVIYHIAPWHLRFWFDFVKWFDKAKVSNESAFTTGYLSTIKLLPIFADLSIAYIIYKISNKLIWPILYLISPFSWYLSALWGQYDQVSYLFVIIAFILESKKKFSILTPFIFAVSIAIKPTSLILAPLFIYIYIKNSHPKTSYLLSSALIIILFYTTTKVFTTDNLFSFTQNTLVNKIFFKSASRLTANAFNFWRIFVGDKVETQEALFLFIPAKWLSYIAFLFFNILAVKKMKEINLKNTLISVFIVSAGSWIFMTNMLDRYFFIAIATGLFICTFNKKTVKYWILLSLIFWLNLYNQWWFPNSLQFLHNILATNNTLVTRLLALINVVIFLKILQILL